MKILLIRYHDEGNINTRLPASLNKVRGVMPPLGLMYVAAVLEEAGYEVSMLDAVALNLMASEVREIISKEKPDVVGITAMIADVRGALEAAKIAKQCNAITVMGGPLLSVYPKQTLSYDFIDYGIVGEGEYPMLELVRAIENKRAANSIAGLAYKEGNDIKVNEPYIVEDLDKVPFPARHLLPMEKYSSIINLYPVSTMITSRGCPFKCGFCVKGPSDKKYRARSPQSVVDEMELIVNKYKVKEIMFYDDTLTLDRKFTVSLCNEILKRGLKIRWESPTRVDRVDLDLLKLMRKAGCVRLRYGIESGDPEILRLMNKGLDLKKARQVFKWTRDCHMESFAYFIIGYIHETPETIKNTISLAKELNPDFVMFTVATPYPTTPLFEMAQKEGLVDGDYWEQFILGKRNDRLKYLVPDAEYWTSRAYKEFYLRGSYIFRRLLKIRSIHDIKRHLDAAQGIFSFKLSEA